jgi:hypothetical protein
MGSMTVNPLTPLYSGATVTRTDTGGSTSTIVVTATTAQSALNFNKLIIIAENYSSTASCTFNLQAGDNFSEVGQGAGATITLATAGTAGFHKVIGGTSFESARFQHDDDYLRITVLTAATVYITAYQLP